MEGNKKTIATVVAVVAIVLLGLLGIVALGESNSGPEADDTNNAAQETPKGDCEISECMKKLEPKMTIEEANKIMGFDGEKSADSDQYTWQLTSKSKIVVEYKDQLGTFTATYDKDQIKDPSFKISKGYELQGLLQDGTSYTYEETVKQFDGVEGYLAVKSPTSKMYMWVNSDGLTFRATFSDSLNGKTSIISIR